MKLFHPHRVSGHAIIGAVALLLLQIPVSRHFLTLYLDESLWHFQLLFTFVAIALLLAYRYGFRGGMLSSVFNTVIAAVAEIAHANWSDRSLDLSMTVAVGLATLVTGIAVSVAVGILAHVLQAQGKWLEALFASASDGFVVISGDRTIVAMNKAAQQISGWTEPELAAAGGCSALFKCGDFRNKCPTYHASCPIALAGSAMETMETEIVQPSGSPVPVSISCSPVELPVLEWRRAKSAAVVVTMRHIATARKLQAEMEDLARICTDISSLDNIAQILQEITSRAGSMISADLVVIALAEDSEGDLTVQHAAGTGADQITGRHIVSGYGVLGRAHRVGEPVVMRQPADDPGYVPERDVLMQATGVVSQVAIPFRGAGGSRGVIGVGWYQPRVVLPNQVNVLRQLANLAAVALENSRLLGRIQQARKEVEVLYQLGLEISSLSDFDRKLELFLETSRLLVGADVTALWVNDEGEGEGRWTAVSAIDPEAAKAWLIRSEQGLVTEVAQAGQVLKAEERQRFRAAVALPLWARGKTIGVLFAGYLSRTSVDDGSVLVLSGLSNQLSVALENARLYGRVQELAVIEERNRLSREIHDGLAQLLSVLNLRAEALKKGLARLRQAQAKGVGDSDQLGADLTGEVEELQAIVDSAHSEVRHSIWNLRRPQQSDQDLSNLLQGFVEQFRRYTGISVTLESECATRLHLPLTIELQVIRIVQESLNNVRKHSGVKTATLSVRVEAETLVLEVRDHGRGFDPDQANSAGKGNYGMSSMQERASAIGADLSIHSRPGSGTTVTLSIALDRLLT